MNRAVIFILIFAPLMLSSCVGKVTPEVYNRSFALLQDSAEANLEAGNHLKAYVLADILLKNEPEREDIYEIKAAALAADPELDKFEHRDVLGSNLPFREQTGASVPLRIVTWPVNVVLDLLDLISVEVGGCIGVGVKAQVTDAIGVGAQISGGQTVFGFHNRHIGSRLTVEEYLDLVFFEMRTLAEGQFNTAGARSMGYSSVGIKTPDDAHNQLMRDYWAIGAQVQAGLVAANVKVHPVQFYDFLATIVFLDPLNDNFASTRGIKFDDDESDAMKRIMRGRDD